MRGAQDKGVVEQARRPAATDLLARRHERETREAIGSGDVYRKTRRRKKIKRYEVLCDGLNASRV